MELIPGIGVELAKIGDPRSTVERRTGPPSRGPSRRNFYDTRPTLVVSYSADDVVEHMDLGHWWGEAEVYFEGIQLTYRFLDEVVADLTAKGHACTPSDIGFDFQAGFSIWSMGSLPATELDPGAGEDDPRMIVEGVGVAPYSYFTSAAG